jgi:hypothetical protein
MDAIHACAREKYEEFCSDKFGGGTNILGISSNLNFSAYFEKICAFDSSSNLGCELIVNQHTRAIWIFNICSIFVSRIRILNISRRCLGGACSLADHAEPACAILRMGCS